MNNLITKIKHNSFRKGNEMRKTLSVCLAALLCAAFLAPAAAKSVPRLAVYVTGDKAENEKKIVAAEIMNSLVKGKRYSAAARSNDFIAALAQEQKKQRVSDAQLREIAAQYGVEHICLADITGVFNTFYISLRIVDAATGEVDAVSSAYGELQRMEDVAKVCGDIVGAMFAVKPADAAAEKSLPADAPNAGNDAVASAPTAGSGDASYYYNQGYANSQSMDHDGAIANYTEALKIDPKLVYALIARGAAYYAKGDYQSAVEDYSRTLELEPNDAGVFNNRGNAYRKMGNYDMARADYEAALRIDPNNTEAKEALELIELDKSGAEKQEPSSRRYGLHYGVTGGLYFNWLTDQYDRALGDDMFDGWGFSGGLALSYQHNDWMAVVAEINGSYREMRSYVDYYNSDIDNIKIKDLCLSVPLMIRVNTPWWQSFGLYAESGIQIEIPWESTMRIRYRSASEDYVDIADQRTNDIQFVVGGGLFFKLGVTWYLGGRLVPSLLNNFVGNNTGRIIQAGGVLSLIY